MVDTLRNRLVQHWGHTIDEATRRVVMFDIQKTDELLYGNWDEAPQRKFGKEIHATKKTFVPTARYDAQYSTIDNLR